MSSEAEERRNDILARFATQIEASNAARADAARDLAKAESKTAEIVIKFTNDELAHFEALCGRLDAVQAAVASQNVVLEEIEKEQKLLRELYQSESERSSRAVRDRLQRSEDLIQAIGAEIARTRQTNDALVTALQSLVERIRALGESES